MSKKHYSVKIPLLKQASTMYNIVIIDDKPLVANHNEKLLNSMNTDTQVVANLDTVLGAIIGLIKIHAI